MSFRVQSIGPIGPAQATMKLVVDVDAYVAAIRSRGHTEILVGNEGGSVEGYEDWRGRRVSSGTSGLIAERDYAMPGSDAFFSSRP